MLHASEMANVWVLRAGERDQLVGTFLDADEVGVVFDRFPDGRTVDRAASLAILGVGLDDEPTRSQEATAAAFLGFVRRMRVGDLVLLVDRAARGLVCGVVSGDYEFRDDIDARSARHRRPVQWRRRLPFADLPDRLAEVPDQRASIELVADGRLRALALACSRGERGEDPRDRPATAPPASRGTPRRRTPAPPRPRRPSQVTRAERRCANCLVTKPAELFDGDRCVDCA